MVDTVGIPTHRTPPIPIPIPPLKKRCSSSSREDNNDEQEKEPVAAVVEMNHLNRRNRTALLICSALFTFFYVGSFFGWGPMQLLLEENGAFSWKCANSSSSSSISTADEELVDGDGTVVEVCSEQTSTLLQVQLIASVTQVLSLPFGLFVDRFGAPVSALFAVLCLLTGLLFWTVSASKHTIAWDRMLFVANALLAMTTWLGSQLTVQTGLYFAGHTQSRVIFLLNALFDAGSITYLFVWWLAHIASLSLTQVSALYLSCGTIVSLTGLYFWRIAMPEADHDQVFIYDQDTTNNTQPDNNNNSSHNKKSTTLSHIKNKEEVDELLLNENDDPVTTTTKQQQKQKDTAVAEPQPFASKTSTTETTAPTPTISSSSNSNSNATTEYILVSQRTIRQQLSSWPYILVCVFFSLHVSMNMWTLSTMRDYLAYLGDDELDNRYLTIFTLLLPVSILAIPVIDVILLRFGFAGGFQTINALALGYSIIRLVTTNLNVQIVSFILFSFYRCFLFGITFSFLPQLLDQQVIGKGTGIIFFVTGVINAIQIPLARLAVVALDGNFFIPNLVFTLLIVPCVIAAAWLSRCIQTENQAKRLQLQSIATGNLQEPTSSREPEEQEDTS